MALKIYINAEANSISASTVVSASDMSYKQLPDFVVGNKPTVELYIVDGKGSYAAASGSSDHTLKVAVGDPSAVPTSGTFTLTSTTTTAALAYNITSANLQTALNGIATILAAGGVTVIGESPLWRVTFNTVGAQTLISGDGTSLSPASTVSVTRTTTGDGSNRDVQVIRLLCNPVTICDSWTAITNGWSGMLRMDYYEVYDLLAGEDYVDSLLQVDVTDPLGQIRTYAEVPAKIFNTVIDPGSLATSSALLGNGVLGDDGKWYPFVVNVVVGNAILGLGVGVTPTPSTDISTKVLLGDDGLYYKIVVNIIDGLPVIGLSEGMIL